MSFDYEDFRPDRNFSQSLGLSVDGVPAYVGNHLQAMFSIKNDHRDDDLCVICRYPDGRTGATWVCYASLGPVSDADLDRWVHGHYPEFGDEDQTVEGSERYLYYRDASNQQLDQEAKEAS